MPLGLVYAIAFTRFDAVAAEEEPPTREERRRMRKDAVARLVRP